MCYQYNRDFRRDIKKDESKDTEVRPEPRVDEPGFKFWAFPRRSREDPATADRTREKV